MAEPDEMVKNSGPPAATAVSDPPQPTPKAGETDDAMDVDDAEDLIGLPTGDFDPDAGPSPPAFASVQGGIDQGVDRRPSLAGTGDDDILKVDYSKDKDEDHDHDQDQSATASEQGQEGNDVTNANTGSGGGVEDEDPASFTAILAELAAGRYDEGDTGVNGDGGDGEVEHGGQGPDERGQPEGEAGPGPEPTAEEVSSAVSTPLSEPPELPTTLPPSPEVKLQPIPAPTLAPAPGPAATPKTLPKRPLSPIRPESEAESSTAAAKRARLSATLSSGAIASEAERNILPGKRARKQIQALEFDELESSDEDRVQRRGAKKTRAGPKQRAPAKKKTEGTSNTAAPPRSFGSPSPPTSDVLRRTDHLSPPPAGPKNLTDKDILALLKGKNRERQFVNCLRPRYAGWGKCCQCVGKVAGDSCRFKDFRMFEVDPNTGAIVDTAPHEDTRLKEDMTPLPRDFNAPWTETEIRRTEATVAPLLLPLISRELRHIINNKAVVREVDVAKHRSVCDFCSSTIFGGYFCCQKCGRDYCLQCERYFSDSTEAMRDSPWDMPDAARPRLMRCTNAPPVKGRLASAHTVPEAIPAQTNDSSGRAEGHGIAKGPVLPEPGKETEQVNGSSATAEADGHEQGRPPAPTAGNTAEPAAHVPTPPPDGSDPAADARPSADAVVSKLPAASASNGAAGDQSTEHAPQPSLMPKWETAGPKEHDDTADADGESEQSAPIAPTPPASTPPQRGAQTDVAAGTKTTRAPGEQKPPPSAKTSAAARRGKPQAPIQRRGLNFHVRPDLVPVTRFHRAELEEHWTKLVAFVLDGEGDAAEIFGLDKQQQEQERELELIKEVQAYIDKYRPLSQAPQANGHAKEEDSRYYTKTTHASARPITDPANLHDQSHPFMLVPASDLDNTLFDRLWAKGEPMVIDKVGERFKQDWTPDTFIRRFGSDPCVVIDCQTDAVKGTTVGDFFQTFKDPEQRSAKGVWKLKDWPSTSDFQSAYPDLYNDFCDSLPVPDFTRREGVLNLYSHFPAGPTKPDIGPKMYNAFAAKETAGGHGSTRLHMDVADAINIMLYASPRPASASKAGGDAEPDDNQESQKPEQEPEPGCAVWDLFRAEDADKIRTFLKNKFGGKVAFTDPIHSQIFYLDAELRRELADKHGVVSFRVYQYPGQAVFIPAGCAHQVCNLADCIKIALDFVSPHNVSRCQQLMHDFRQENFVKAWKDDVLQLYNVMWYSWLNAQETRERRRQEALAEQAKIDNPNSTNTGISPETRPRILATQVSSVRDEPQPTPVPSPAPTPPRDTTPDPRADDRDRLSTKLFKHMLAQSELAPPAALTDEEAERTERRERARQLQLQQQEQQRQSSASGFKTSDLIKGGLFSADQALKAIGRQLVKENEDGEDGPHEFSLASL